MPPWYTLGYIRALVASLCVHGFDMTKHEPPLRGA